MKQSRIWHLLQMESVSGVFLLIAAACAMLWANSSFSSNYHDLWHVSIPINVGLDTSLHFFINDMLMAVFFLSVGLEIRHEAHDGALSNARQALLPVIAALGGVVVPALIFLGINSSSGQQRGWAVPTATDIAFALSVLALLGRSIPSNVRVFLLALAIIDDIIAVLIIAFFYSSGLNYSGFMLAGAGILLALGFKRLGISMILVYIVCGAMIWAGMLLANIHPALAGVVLGFMTPIAEVTRIQKKLQPWVAFMIMPLFALANAGVGINVSGFAAVPLQVMIGVIIALVVGKPIGVVGISWLAVRLGWCHLPPGVTWKGIILIGLLAGIGFTMSIFIAVLAFADEGMLNAAKLGVVAGSSIAAIIGLGWGVIYVRQLRRET